LLSFHHTQLDRIDQCAAHPHVTDNHDVVSGRSPLVLAQKLLGRCNRPVRTAREIDAGGKRSPTKRELPINFLAWGESKGSVRAVASNLRHIAPFFPAE
jgi:hypothetical protein